MIARLTIVFMVIYFLEGTAAQKFKDGINLKNQTTLNYEKFYANLSNYANSPLVECSYLPEQFYECPNIHDNNSTNCTKVSSLNHC